MKINNKSDIKLQKFYILCYYIVQYLVFHNIFDVKVWWGHKIVRRLVLWNQQFLRYAYKFWKEYKTTNVHMYWKLSPNTFNHSIIKYKLHGMVTRCSRRWVPWRSTTSVFFSFSEVKYQLKHHFTLILNLTNCSVKLTMFYKERELRLTMSAEYA